MISRTVALLPVPGTPEMYKHFPTALVANANANANARVDCTHQKTIVSLSFYPDVASNASILTSLSEDVQQDILNLASNVALIESLRADTDSNSASILSII